MCEFSGGMCGGGVWGHPVLVGLGNPGVPGAYSWVVRCSWGWVWGQYVGVPGPNQGMGGVCGEGWNE